jgi:hypothetical protein
MAVGNAGIRLPGFAGFRASEALLLKTRARVTEPGMLATPHG